ncbi:hypothetical protein FHW67_002250 [Herbaspirillum sp. Sphag1AN]|uniref:hypothetical protein n=1 Tax=unclassified Herbaspirillum TaxID=2624150 RepID=UPI00160E10F7|nr:MULTISPECIES: hypothetical protein [unclassified Herbaspirillum]MBB3212962.1 hypothetical protein [Herbaspirillum sp. Sphag1AN]MBB3246159.1 hypothetical protein [Herbaspirillum sp. Sphag64]
MAVSYLRIFFLIGLLPVALLSALNLVVDPYDIFQTGILRESGATQERYLKIEMMKKNKSFDTFLFGGSRMGTTVPADIEPILPGTHIYNFYVSSGNQTDNLVHGLWLLKTQPQLKTFYVQVDWPDSVGLTKANYQYWTHPEVLHQSSAGFLAQYLFLLSYNAIDFKIENNSTRKGEVKRPMQGGYYYFPKRDQEIASDCRAYVAKDPNFTAIVAPQSPSIDQRKLIDANLAELEQLIQAAHQYGVDVRLYITPHHHKFLDHINIDDYRYFLTRLAKISPFWNFGIYSDVTMNDCNYYETSHYIRSVAPTLFKVMSNTSKDSGLAHFVTIDSIDQELNFVRLNFAQHRTIQDRNPR